jgi:KipI family sensor histidine kinase inhibitor
MTQYPYRIEPNSEIGFTVIFDEPVSAALSQYIIGLADSFRAIWPVGTIETIPAYNSLTVLSYSLDKSQCLDEMRRLISDFESKGLKETKCIDVPVCYHKSLGIDLLSFADRVNLSVDEVIKRHSHPEYLVHMLGFLPGFLYLGGLDETLHCPRKLTPVTQVPAGSVGIGGSQTGVYPVASPAGWHILGQTPMQFFNPDAEQPFAVKPLDTIRFIPISLEDFNQRKQKNRVTEKPC